MIRSRAALLLLMVGVVLSSGQAAPETTSVTILAVTPFGEILSPVKVTRFVAEGGRGDDYSSRFMGTRADGIPYGPYTASVMAGGRGITAPVRVGRANTFIVMSVPEAFIERGPGTRGVTGRVAGVDTSKPVWIRFVRVFSEDFCCTIVALSEDGTFSFGGLDAADYVLLVLTDGRVLFEGRVRIDAPNAIITVDLATAKATVQP
jgi:hypothetical protein